MGKKKTHEDVMNNLMSVPEVREHMNKPQVKLGLEIVGKRVRNNIASREFHFILEEAGYPLTIIQLAKVETGDVDMDVEYFENTLKVLDEYLESRE